MIHRWAVPGAVLTGVTAGGLVLVMNLSPRLPGTHSDGVEYVAAAESLARHGAFTIPVTHWSDPDSVTALSHYPPGFSLAIAAPMRVAGVSAEASVELVLAAGAALATGMTFWLAAAAGGLWAGGLAALLFVSTPALSRLYVAVWSECLYLGIALAVLWTLVAWPRRRLLHGVLAAVGVAVRYVGVAGALAAMWFAWFRGRDLRDRLIGVALTGTPTLAVLLGWQAFAGSAGEEIRVVGVYAGLPAQSRQFLLLVADWLSPLSLRSFVPVEWVILALPVGIAAVMFGGWPRSAEDPSGTARRIRSVLVVFGAAYGGVVVVSRLFLDPLIPFDTRLFAPVLLTITVGFAVCVVQRARRWPPSRGVALFGVVAVWMCLGIVDVREIVSQSGHVGRFYTHDAWVAAGDDSAVGWAFRESAGYPYLYSNEAALVFYHGGRAAKHLVRSNEDADAFQEAFRQRPGPVLVTFPLKTVDVPPDDFVSALGLRLFRDTGEAKLYLPGGSPELQQPERAGPDG
ncbi:MAG TPA: hypothetical protein VLA43_17340 [Longimicrobiales bacterium]|nr:hypothetical protein [Longimicrobiales bacterium]